jgi:hypothetical protein
VLGRVADERRDDDTNEELRHAEVARGRRHGATTTHHDRDAHCRTQQHRTADECRGGRRASLVGGALCRAPRCVLRVKMRLGSRSQSTIAISVSSFSSGAPSAWERRNRRDDEANRKRAAAFVLSPAAVRLKR